MVTRLLSDLFSFECFSLCRKSDKTGRRDCSSDQMMWVIWDETKRHHKRVSRIHLRLSSHDKETVRELMKSYMKCEVWVPLSHVKRMLPLNSSLLMVRVVYRIQVILKTLRENVIRFFSSLSSCKEEATTTQGLHLLVEFLQIQLKLQESKRQTLSL